MRNRYFDNLDELSKSDVDNLMGITLKQVDYWAIRRFYSLLLN